MFAFHDAAGGIFFIRRHKSEASSDSKRGADRTIGEFARVSLPFCPHTLCEICWNRWLVVGVPAGHEGPPFLSALVLVEGSFGRCTYTVVPVDVGGFASPRAPLLCGLSENLPTEQAPTGVGPRHSARMLIGGGVASGSCALR